MTTGNFDLEHRLNEHRSANLMRNLEPAESIGARSRFLTRRTDEGAKFGSEEKIFASNNYLGLISDKRVRQAAEEAIRNVGSGTGASRLLTGDTDLHHTLEQEIAECKETEKALVFSSGYAANVGTIAALEPDLVFSDELNHASIIDGCRLADAETVVYDHCNTGDLATKMSDATTNREPNERWLVITDTVFSMDGDIAPLKQLCDVAERYNAWIMADEAHATGLFGNGGGIIQREGLEDRIDVQVGTLSKALASQGGYVAGNKTLIKYLINNARSFMFSTGLAPPAVGAAYKALKIARNGNRTEQLWENVEHLRSGLTSAGYEVLGNSHILPVMIGDRKKALEIGRKVRKQGIVAPPIRPPTVPEGTSRIRITPMATHDKSDIETCIKAFRKAGEDTEVISA